MATRKIPQERIDIDVSRRYEVGKRIGRGCYGIIFQAEEINNLGHYVAIKKVLNAFHTSSDAQRTYREVMYLQQFGNHENILGLHDVLGSADDKHIYLITELMDSDLQKAIRCRSLKPEHPPYITWQLLRALKYIHSAGVTHRDMKPANILLNISGEIVLGDFGWARSAPPPIMSDIELTEYASSRWYRAPEILLSGSCYSTAIDMWALGCIVGEMHSGKPLIGGSSTLDMMEKIKVMLGKPLPHDILAMQAPYARFTFNHMQPGPPKKPMSEVFPHEKPELYDFLSLLLQYNPEKRLTAEEALDHPYVGSFHDPDDEPRFGRDRIQLALPDTKKYSAARYRDQIYAEVIGLENAKSRVRQVWSQMADEDD